MFGRLKGVIWPILTVAAAFGLYKVKYEVQAVQQQIVTLERELSTERESLNVVAAEWAYLTRPSRLQELSTKYLALEAIHTEQLSEVADIQYVPFPSRTLARQELQEMRNNPVEPVSLLQPVD